MDIGKKVLKDIKSRKLDLCESYTERIKTSKNYGLLCAMFFKGDDWALRNNFPGLDLLRIHKEGIQKHHLMVDSEGDFLNLQKVAFFGLSKNRLFYDQYHVGSVTVRHDSKIIVSAKDNSIVYLTCLDNSDIDVEVKDSAKVTVFCIGEGVKIKSTGNIKVIKKNEFSTL